MNTWFIAMVIVSFASVIGFFNINSAWADEKKWNKKLLVVSILLALVAVFFLYKVITTSN